MISMPSQRKTSGVVIEVYYEFKPHVSAFGARLGNMVLTVLFDDTVS